MTTEDFITDFSCRIADQMKDIGKHPQANCIPVNWLRWQSCLRANVWAPVPFTAISLSIIALCFQRAGAKKPIVSPFQGTSELDGTFFGRTDGVGCCR